MNYYIIFGITIIVSIILLIICLYFSKRDDIVVPEEKIKLYNTLSGALKNLKSYEYDEVAAFRDLPFKDNYFLAAYVASIYGIGQGDNISILLLSWIKNDIVKLIYENNKLSKIKLIKEPIEPLEKQFYIMMEHAADDDILDMDEFKYYCKENYKNIKNWLGNVNANKCGEILNNRDLVSINKVNNGLLKPGYEFVATDKLNELALHLAGLKKFLHEFSLINEKQVIEVKLWKEYLIYAQIFGIAYDVQETFKKFYNINIYDFIDMKTLEEYSTSVVLASFKSVEASERMANFTLSNISFDGSNFDKDYSKNNFGGGGFSSGGGGSGSFGGGGGGGGFR